MKQNEDHKVNFVVSANFKDYHATVIFTVLDVQQKPILVSLINSWIHQDDSYHSYSKYRFDMVTTGSRDELNYQKITFLETSYDLQKTSDDNNCVIYSLNNIKAIIDMLQNKEIAKNLLELAKRLGYRL